MTMLELKCIMQTKLSPRYGVWTKIEKLDPELVNRNREEDNYSCKM